MTQQHVSKAHEWALILARAGVRVFPLYGVYEAEDGRLVDEATGDAPTHTAGSGKKPRLPVDWRVVATRNPEIIDQWFRDYPRTNYGCVMGEGVVVVDCDSQEAMEIFLIAWQDEEQYWLETFHVNTAQGAHFYFLGDSATYKPTQKVDLKGRGGYVVGPGSRSWNGSYYEPQLPQDQLSMVDLPPWLGKAATNRAETDDEGSVLVIRDGDRNNGLTKVAGHFRRMGLDAATTRELLRVVNDRVCETPLDAVELETTLFSSLGKWAAGTLVDDEIAASVLFKDDLAGEQFFRMWNDRELDPPPRWLYKDLIPEQGLVQLFGASYSGKTFVAIDMALSVCNGRPWFGFEHTGREEKDHAIYFLAEGTFDFKQRVKAWCSARDGRDQRLITVENHIIDLGTRDGWKRVGQEVMQDPRVQEVWDRVGLVVLDTQSLLLFGDENSNTEMNRAMGTLKTVAKTIGCPVVLVHHTGTGNVDRARGASSIFAAMDTVVKIGRQRGYTQLEVKKVKASRLPEEPIMFDLEEQDGSVVVTPQFTPVPRADTTMEQVVTHLEEHGGVSTWSAIREMLGILRTSARESEVFETLRSSAILDVAQPRRGVPTEVRLVG